MTYLSNVIIKFFYKLRLSIVIGSHPSKGWFPIHHFTKRGHIEAPNLGVLIKNEPLFYLIYFHWWLRDGWASTLAPKLFGASFHPNKMSFLSLKIHQIRFFIKKSKMMLIFFQISLINCVVLLKKENVPGHVIYDRPNGLVYESIQVTSPPEM